MNFPAIVFQPPDPEPDAVLSVAAWATAAGVTNVRAPMALDPSSPVWPIASADGIICINMVHISPWEATLGLINGAAAALSPASPLYLYGPYKREGFATAPSNQASTGALLAIARRFQRHLIFFRHITTGSRELQQRAGAGVSAVLIP